MSDYLIIGLNHESAPLELREKLAISDESLPFRLNEFSSMDNIEEGLILSTCNRVEYYAVTDNKNKAVESMRGFLSRTCGVQSEVLQNCVYEHSSVNAVLHSFRVAASLDSMVLGENQILGQVKRAYQLALEAKKSGLFLNKMMHRAITVAKKVRTETNINNFHVSVGSIAVDLARKIFGEIHQTQVCVLGMGEMGRLVLERLRQEGVEQVALVNRTFEKSVAIENMGLGKAYSIDDLRQVLLINDILITSLSGNDPFLKTDFMDSLMKERKGKPLFIIDLGVPRNVDQAVNAIDNIYLYNIDDLEQVASKNRRKREVESQMAEDIIQKEAYQFYTSMVHQKPAIAQLGKKFDAIRMREVERALKKMNHVSEEDKAIIHKCTESIVSRILHDPIIALKSDDMDDKDWDADRLLKKLFRLEGDSDG